MEQSSNVCGHFEVADILFPRIVLLRLARNGPNAAPVDPRRLPHRRRSRA